MLTYRLEKRRRAVPTKKNMTTQIVATIMSVLAFGLNANALVLNQVTNQTVETKKEIVLGQKEFSLEKRYAIKSVNEVMKKNILLNLAYMNGTVTKKADIDWAKVTSPFHFQKTLGVGETFAYHTVVRQEYEGKVAFTTNTSFNAADGYLSDGYLFGDGVCHIASLINWAAIDAGLKTVVPKDHRSVGPIPDVPDDYGVSIYKNGNIGANNNLYITNTKDVPVTLHFDFDGKNVKVYVTQNGEVA